ncbi:ATPase, T2SS/T4P/T4SS family [Cysteiniphilum sp. JM-1]|uniref:ATPase, T2SS/T4P/T4SS family n=1 Tax=Cysteiniphilum sp. JM-1 TaxID=2610891 RepID=UPI001247F659|nr:ATPase, T2SS/T4P/T4SS family [Cysteiniphilum sp. JM-1]
MNRPLLYPQEPHYWTHYEFERFLLTVLADNNTSDLTIQTGYPIIVERSGIASAISKRALSYQETCDLANYIYGANAVSLISSAHDLDISYQLQKSQGQYYRLRVNISACHGIGGLGIQISLRVLKDTPLCLDTFNLPSDLYQALTTPHGLTIVSGATGSGKSTLLASVMRSLLQQPNQAHKILSYEAPIEYVFDKINSHASMIAQAEIPRHLKSFSLGIRNALRRKPTTIMLGETRDMETLDAVLEAALTGHPVYTTIHSNSVSDTLTRILNMFPAQTHQRRAYDIIQALHVIIWQRLLPTRHGQLIAVREYLVFDDQLKAKLLKSEPQQSHTIISSTLSQRHSHIENAYKQLLQQGQLDLEYIPLTIQQKLIANNKNIIDKVTLHAT